MTMSKSILADMRKDKGLSQDAVQEAVGIPAYTLARLEKGLHLPAIMPDRWLALAKLYGVRDEALAAAVTKVFSKKG